MFLIIGGCYSERKATEQVIKAQARYPGKVSDLATLWYPIKVVKRDSIIYKPGQTKYLPGATPKAFDCDSAVKASKLAGKPQTSFTVPCIPDTVTRVDTLYRSSDEVQESTLSVESEKHKGKKLQEQYDESRIKIARQSQTIEWLWIAVIALGVYTLGRWALRMICGIKIP